MESKRKAYIISQKNNLYIDNEINLADKKNISMIKEGNISITYKENSSKLSSEVKALLPRPFVKLMG